jgi:hypothetical protein
MGELKSQTEIDWREWKDQIIAFRKLNEILSGHGVELSVETNGDWMLITAHSFGPAKSKTGKR